jgi:hypothetical protein
MTSSLTDPAPGSHTVQFYESDQFLVDAVVRYLGAGLEAQHRLIVIATAEHRRAFLAGLPEQARNRAIGSGELLVLDARETLSKFMIGDIPDPDLFRVTIGQVLARARNGHDHTRLRAYGEMVDVLWRDGNSRGAIRLEELWNDVAKEAEFSLLCAYTMSNFQEHGSIPRFMDVCRAHSHVIPTEEFGQLDDAHARLREISLLQQRARALESELQHRKKLEQSLRDALRERGRVEEELRASVKREREARTQAEASDAFKEIAVHSSADAGTRFDLTLPRL